MRLVTRESLGWPSMARTNVFHADTNKGLVLHWDGGKRGLIGKPHSACVAYWQWCRAFHMGPSRRWKDIGYSYGVCPHGYVFEGRTYGYEQAAQPGGNFTWVSVTLMLAPGEMPTPEQIEALKQLRSALIRRGMGSAIRGHYQFVSTDCPGPNTKRMIGDGTFTGAPVKVSWTEKLIKDLPTLGKGDTGNDVKTIRALAWARGYVEPGDYNETLSEFLDKPRFDAGLEKIVKRLQRAKKLDADGIVGPLTWPALLGR